MVRSNPRIGGSFLIFMFRARDVGPSTLASWLSLHLKSGVERELPQCYDFAHPENASRAISVRPESHCRPVSSRTGYRSWLGGRTRRASELPGAQEIHAKPRMHQILPGGDIRLKKNIIWSLGVGVGITPATDRIVYKSRLEISFGGKPRH